MYVHSHVSYAICILFEIVQPQTPGTGRDRSPIGAEGACCGQQRDQDSTNVHRQALAAAVPPVEVRPAPAFLSGIAEPSRAIPVSGMKRTFRRGKSRGTICFVVAHTLASLGHAWNGMCFCVHYLK